ncbi:MAG: LPS-assembly protein LptD [Proteobacteria bacterium]|nr:LPS-assembly protein LptD [Pseudomonadota bacterium]
MKLFSRSYICLPVTLLSTLSVTPIALAMDNISVANQLGWVSAPEANICHGYFSEPPIVLENPTPNLQAPVHISYAGPGTLSTYGESVISQEVLITQPGRLIKADRAVIYRDPKTGQLGYVKLEGHVEVREKGKLLVGPYSIVRFDQHTVEVGQSAYHLYEDPNVLKLPNVPKPYDAWGTADRSYRDNQGVIQLTNATYSTCEPTNPAWQISAGKIDLDQKSGWGTAYNMKLRFYDVPVLYVPLYTFPIDNRRKTGFLTPDITYQSANGLEAAFPFYWNLAPNYDLTTTPKVIQTRGLLLNNLFRYLLSPGNNGEMYLSFNPYDPKFNQFRKDTLANPGEAPPGVSLTPYLNDLASDGSTRAFFHLYDSAHFNDNWNGHILLNYVTDDYFFQDYGSAYSDIIANQLPNQGDIEYRDNNISFIGLIQGYQTLHIIGQAANPALDQYTRLPELDFNSDFADLFYGLDFSLGAQSVNFAYNSQFEPETTDLPVGERLHLRPTLSWPLFTAGAYLTPQIALDSTSYATKLATDEADQDQNQIQPNGDFNNRPSFDASRNIPIFDVDSGLYFDRPLFLDDRHYLATLEPRFYYLYVPYVNQNKYPNFDSELLPFTFEQLFDVNRFTSYDRLENANQISLGLTSRFLNSDTSFQKLKFDTGFGYYLESPKVCLDPTDCSTSTDQFISPHSRLTPLVAQLTYYPWKYWSTTASYAYDVNVGATNNAQIGVDFDKDQTYVFTFNYMYVREQNFQNMTDSYGFSNSTNLINAGFAWPFTIHWSGLAYGQYNISKERPDSYYGGLAYDTCCWSFRVIASRSFWKQTNSDDGSFANIYKNAYYVQLQLKSLGTIGNKPGSLISQTLSNFADPFK